jgi:hypothetical protein
MNTDPTNLPDLFPLVKGMKLRTRKLGANPVSPLFPVSIGTDNHDSPDPRHDFTICWEDPKLGVTVRVREQENGRLIADVFSADAALLDKAWVSVSLIGTGVNHISHKSIPLKVAEKNGCSGSADFGPLADAVKELGPQLGVVVMLLV